MASSASDENPTTVDDYFNGLSDDQRATVVTLRMDLHALLPHAVDGMSYGIPCVRVDGVPIVGYAAFTAHCSLFPHSGSVLSKISDIPTWCEAQRGTLRYPIGKRLPKRLLTEILKVKRAELEEKAKQRRRRR